MKFAAFRCIFLAAALAILSKHGAFSSKTTSTSAAMTILARCPKSKCLTDAISCLSGANSDDAGNSGQASKLAKLEKEVANLKAELAKAGKPSGFAMLDSSGHLPQKFLVAGYDKYSAYDLAWQSLHMAAAAACRGSTPSGGTGCCNNAVMVRNVANKKTCTDICAQTVYRNCDAEVSIYGRNGQAKKNGEEVGTFYNYQCSHSINGGSEVNAANESIMNRSGGNHYFSFCCCRK